MIKSKLFSLFTIALLGIALSMTVAGCKKEAPMEKETQMEEEAPMEESADMSSAEETE